MGGWITIYEVSSVCWEESQIVSLLTTVFAQKGNSQCECQLRFVSLDQKWRPATSQFSLLSFQASHLQPPPWLPQHVVDEIHGSYLSQQKGIKVQGLDGGMLQVQMRKLIEPPLCSRKGLLLRS